MSETGNALVVVAEAKEEAAAALAKGDSTTANAAYARELAARAGTPAVAATELRPNPEAYAGGWSPTNPVAVRGHYSETVEGKAGLASWPTFAVDLPFAQAEMAQLLKGCSLPSARTRLADSFSNMSDAEQLDVLRALAGRGRMNAVRSGVPSSIAAAPSPSRSTTTMSRPDLSDDAELRQVRADIAEAQRNREPERAQRLYKRELDLIAAKAGNGPIVNGRRTA